MDGAYDIGIKSKKPFGFWKKHENCKKFMDELKVKLNITTNKELYNLSARTISKHGGKTLVSNFDGSTRKMLEWVYPDVKLYPWLFKKVPENYWDNIENIKSYIDWLKGLLNIINDEELCELTSDDITDNHGGGLLRKYGSPRLLLQYAYPDLKFNPWEFKKVPENYWNDIENVRKYMEWLKEELHVKTYEDWYNVPADSISDYGANGLLKKFNGSLQKILQYVYPDSKLYPWLFNRVLENYWDDIENVRQYVDWLKGELHIINDEDWCDKWNKAVIISKGGGGLLKRFDTSPQALLRYVYPDLKINPWEFNIVPIGYWAIQRNVRQYMDWLKEKLNIRTHEDWYNLTCMNVKENYGGGVLNRFNGSPELLLQSAYPEHVWIKSKFKAYGYSKVACEWMNILSLSILMTIQHMLNGGEYIINELGRQRADGFIAMYGNYKKIILEFHGCIWHGCPSCINNITENHNGSSLAELYEKTNERTRKLRAHGYIVIEIWECDYKRLKRENTDWKKWFEDKLNSSSN
jgi:hypothetical protein